MISTAAIMTRATTPADVPAINGISNDRREEFAAPAMVCDASSPEDEEPAPLSRLSSVVVTVGCSTKLVGTT